MVSNQATPRMVVFVPGLLENAPDFARRVYDQAAAQQRRVIYLAVKNCETDPLAAARQLATITALTQGSAVQASAQQIDVADLPEALRRVTHPGDLVIWPEMGLLAPASLEGELGIHQQVLDGVYTSAAFCPAPWFKTLLFVLVGILILVGFTILEVRLDARLSGAPQKIGLILLFLLELGAFSLWNRIFG